MPVTFSVFRRTYIFATLVCIFASVLLYNSDITSAFFKAASARVNSRLRPSIIYHRSINSSMTVPEACKKGEVYFLSHGGPPTMFDTQSEAYNAWKLYGKAIEASKPRGLIVVSAHWENESGGSGVQYNTDPSNPLIYDFYGFPRQFYTQTFESKGDSSLLKEVQAALLGAGIKAEGVPRGLDHGVWVPFKVAFGGRTDMPVIQVSLPGDSSPQSTAALGKALSSLREKGYGIMGTGQIVHNLRDAFSGSPAPYSQPFMKDTATALKSSSPLDSTINLFRHPLYKRAHPTPEHLLPLVLSVGATDQGDRLETLFAGTDKMGLGWGMWRWIPQESA